MWGIGRSAGVLIVACALGVSTAGATTRTPSRTATPTAAVTQATTTPTATGTATGSERFDACCQLANSCQKPPDIPYQLCSPLGPGGIGYPAPYKCNEATGRCEIPPTTTAAIGSPSPPSTPTCTPHSAPYCAPDESRVCPPDPCGYCECVTNTETPTATATGTCTVRPSPPRTCTPGMSWVCSPTCHDDCGCVLHTPTPTQAAVTSTPTPGPTQTCPPPPPPPTCSAGEALMCSEPRCSVGCRCVTPTPATSPTMTATCGPPVQTPPHCDADENLACFDYACGFGCACACPGDCNLDEVVKVDELVSAVRIAVDDMPPTACLAAICDCSPGTACADGIRIDCLIRAVERALSGCAQRAAGTPTPPLGESCDPALDGPPDDPPPGRQGLLRLTEASTITLPDGSVEAISGALLVSDCSSPNTFFAARIETLLFSSTSVLVESGCSAIGRVSASTLYGGDTPVEFTATVRIAGEVLRLDGRGPYVSWPTARVIDVDLAAGSYRLHLVALQDEILNPEADERLCWEWGIA